MTSRRRSSFSPLVAIVALVPDAAQHSDETLGLAMLPVGLATYAILLALVALDTILVGTYHARLARPVDAATLAKVFE